MHHSSSKALHSATLSAMPAAKHGLLHLFLGTVFGAAIGGFAYSLVLPVVDVSEPREVGAQGAGIPCAPGLEACPNGQYFGGFWVTEGSGRCGSIGPCCRGGVQENISTAVCSDSGDACISDDGERVINTYSGEKGYCGPACSVLPECTLTSGGVYSGQPLQPGDACELETGDCCIGDTRWGAATGGPMMLSCGANATCQLDVETPEDGKICVDNGCRDGTKLCSNLSTGNMGDLCGSQTTVGCCIGGVIQQMPAPPCGSGLECLTGLCMEPYCCMPNKAQMDNCKRP